MGVVMACPKNAVGASFFRLGTPSSASKNLIFRFASGQQALNEYSPGSTSALSWYSLLFALGLLA